MSPAGGGSRSRSRSSGLGSCELAALGHPLDREVSPHGEMNKKSKILKEEEEEEEEVLVCAGLSWSWGSSD